MPTPRLSIHKLCKSFSSPVLKEIELALAPGEILGLVGENGAGKSTLINILIGAVARDCGEIDLDGHRHEPTSPREAIDAGVSCVTQELSIVETMSVAENILLSCLPNARNIILRDELTERAKQQLARVGLGHLDPNATAAQLGLADKQLLELAKALATDCRLLLLDEPTSALTATQATHLHETVRAVARTGTSVVYVSHRLDDVLEISDSLTVLRDGQIVASGLADSFSIGDIMEKMAGRRQALFQSEQEKSCSTDPVLEVNEIETKALPHAISFTCHAGEIVGVAGLAGAGRSELLQALFGLDGLVAGSVYCVTAGHKNRIDNPSSAVRQGIGYLGEDRQTMGLFSGQSVLANITLPGIKTVSSRLGVVQNHTEMRVGSELVDRLGIRCREVHQEIDELSGGNQQKALIARWLHCDSTILLLDEPTRGVDIGTKNTIYEILFELQGAGKAMVIASSEIDELMTICDRIIVMSNRKLVKVFERDKWSETEILSAAFQEFTFQKRETASGAESGKRRA